MKGKNREVKVGCLLEILTLMFSWNGENMKLVGGWLEMAMVRV